MSTTKIKINIESNNAIQISLFNFYQLETLSNLYDVYSRVDIIII